MSPRSGLALMKLARFAAAVASTIDPMSFTDSESENDEKDKINIKDNANRKWSCPDELIAESNALFSRAIVLH